MQKTQEQTSSRSAEKLYKFFIYFVLVMLAVTIIVPVAWVFMASIKQNSEFYGNPWALPAGFYWQNFVDAWNGAKMGQYMLNSVAVTALALVLLLVIALPAAYCLSRFKFRGSKLLNTLFMAGLFINVNYIVVPIFLMLRDGDTWLKNVLGSSFLLNNLVVLAVVYASTALPFTIYLLSGYFATLPHDFEEAAYIDGASYFAAMVRIIFPMAKPSIITIILFNFLSFWNEYIISMTLMSSTSAERVHHLDDPDELDQRPPHPAGRPAQPDAGPAERGPVRHHVRRPGAGHAAHPDPLHLRPEAADPGHDGRRPEGLKEVRLCDSGKIIPPCASF